MRQLPTGTVTLLFTDMEGSTRLLQQLGVRYGALLGECRRLLRMAFEQEGGYEVDTQGDAFFVVFEQAVDAITAAISAQRTLFASHWPDDVSVRVRIGIHTGEPQPAEEGYIGLDVHRAARIMSAAHGGQVLLSETTRDLVAHDLPADVGLRDLGEYRLKDIAEPSRLFQLVAQDLPTDFPPPSASSSQRPLRNIPSPSTSFIGRDQEVAAVCGRLRSADVRLLTLIGTAGVGKTRLALQVAAQPIDLFTDGVCFVALDQISDADEVVSALAQALNIQEEKERSLFERVKVALRELSLLLILDNFEQVLPARLVVADLLAACPRLKVLVTSRVMLHIQAEHIFDVAPLPLPDPGHLPDLASDYASIALFVQRARAVQPDFHLTPHNVAAVVGICTRLDGIPLAIELAAAGIRHFPPQTLLTHLERGMAILKASAQDMPARQQTLQGAIAWSYELLESAEQCVFRRLAICPNGATLEATERVSTAAGAIEESVAEVLESLADKSMLQRQAREKEQVRFWQLQTLREYGLERLAQAGETEITHAAHAAYYLSWAEQVAPWLSGAEQARWLDRVDREYENVKVALEWMLSERAETEIRRAEEALRLCIALMGFWEIRGYFSEGLAFLERVVEQSQDVAPTVRAQALQGAGFLALMQDDNARAEKFLHESQLLFRESGDKAGMANILRLQGNLAMTKNTYKLARRLLEGALSLYKELGDTQRIASTHEALAQVAIAQCDFSRARTLLEENLASYRALGQQYHAAYPLYHLARALFLARGDREQAQGLAEESLALFRAVGNRRLVAYTLSLLGQLVFMEGEDSKWMLEEAMALFKAVEDRSGTAEVLIAFARLAAFQGDESTARAAYEESLELLQAIGAKELSAACLEGLGEVLVAQGEPRRAVQLWATAATVRATILAPMPPVYRLAYEEAVTTVREQLGDEGFQAAWDEGRRVPLERQIAPPVAK